MEDKEDHQEGVNLRRELRRQKEHPTYGRGDQAEDVPGGFYLVYPHWRINPEFGTEEKIHYTVDHMKGPGRRPAAMPPDEWEEVRKTRGGDTYRNLKVAICGRKYAKKNYVTPVTAEGDRATCTRCLGAKITPNKYADPEAKQRMRDKGRTKQ